MNVQTSQQMTARADIMLSPRSYQLALAVECMMYSDSSMESAAYLRSKFLEYDLIPDAAFFMLATSAGLYLWKQQSDRDALPDFYAPTKAVMSEYLRRLADQADGLSKESLKWTVATWLDDLASGIREPDPKSEADEMLVRSGLFEKMQGGTIRMGDDL